MSFYREIVDLFIEGFRGVEERALPERADLLLQRFFHRFSTDFASFCRRCQLSLGERERFFSYLIREIYYNESFSSDKTIDERMVLILLAEALPEEGRFDEILSSLEENEQLKIVSYALVHRREGAWRIFELLEKIHEDSQNWQELLHKLMTGYFHLKKMRWMVEEENNHHLATIVAELEEYSRLKVEEIQRLLIRVIDLIIDSPLRGFRIIEMIHAKMARKEVTEERLETMRKDALLAQGRLQALFGTFRQECYSMAERRAFFELFGVTGYFLDTPSTTNLLDLEKILAVIEQVLLDHPSVPVERLTQMQLFVLSLCQNLYSFHREPSRYRAGLNRLVYSISTRGLDCGKRYWFTSVLKGLAGIIDYCNSRGISARLDDHPIIIFDQSLRKNYRKNHSYVQRAAQRYGAQVWHIRRKETLAFARKLNLEPWIKSASCGNFGYGGARNCVFFLSPVIHFYAQRGLRTVGEILKIDKKELLRVFDEVVLGENGKDVVLHVAEDDLAMPRSNFFNDALFVDVHRDRYFVRPSSCIGRDTLSINPFVDLQQLMKSPSTLFFSSCWLDLPLHGAMRGMLSKPRFCLPLPFGSEEGHVSCLEVRYDSFSHWNIHFGGTRYPDEAIPKSPLHRMLSFLRPHLIYVIQISMQTLIDSCDGGSIFPWNDPSIRAKKPFHNLKELMGFALDSATIAEMKRRFWSNMESHFLPSGRVVNKPFLRQVMEKLMEEIDPSLDLSWGMRDLYLKVQLDCEMFLLLGRLSQRLSLRESVSRVERRSKKKMIELPLTDGLRRLISMIEHFPPRTGRDSPLYFCSTNSRRSIRRSPWRL